MKKEDLLKLGLPEDLAEKAAQASTEELKGFIPKTRFDEVNDAKKKLEDDIKTRDQQLEDLKKIDAEALKAQIEKLQSDNQAAKDKYEADIKQIKLDAAVEKALIGANAKNLKAVKALLNLQNAELEGESVKGLEDQIKKLQESEDSKFLFNTDSKPSKFKGFVPGEKKDGTPGFGGTAGTLADAIRARLEGE